jgi:hypothetical protein
MAKNKSNNVNNKMGRQRVRKVKAIGGSRPRSVPRGMASGAGDAYLRLLADPCAGAFTHPPYAGTDSGYMLRTVEYLNVQAAGFTGLTVGQTTISDFAVQVCPATYSGTGATSGLVVGSAPAGTAFVLSPVVSQSFIAQNTAVKKFRCLAGCAKFIPNGPYNTRQGTIAVGYNSGMFIAPSTTSAKSSVFSQQMLDTSANGSKEHQVKFLPAAEDETWNDPGVGDVSSYAGGTMMIVGSAIDSVALSATVAQLNGIVEVTLVWEWTPTATVGLSTMPRTPSPNTLQQVLSRIKDIGSFVLGAAHDPMVQQAVTYGIRAYGSRGAGVPMLTY